MEDDMVKKHIALVSFFFCAILLLASCMLKRQQGDPDLSDDSEKTEVLTDSLGHMFRSISENALPALETETGTDSPGTIVDTKYLKRAPRDLVGKTVEITLDGFSDGAVYYRYMQTDKTLVVIWEELNLSPVMLVMKTGYSGMGEFLSQKTVWKGTVTDIAICDGTEVIDIGGGFSLRVGDEEHKTADSSSRICYGWLESEKMTVIDGETPISQFENTCKRFGAAQNAGR